MFQKVLVANRGEIAVRAFRAAYELGYRTVAVFAYEDRNADHRIKAQESYLIGEEGHPVRAYLDIDEIIRAAKESGSDAIYPGYGFLSENPHLAAACAENGITFIGPSADVLSLAGNKVRNRWLDPLLERKRARAWPSLARRLTRRSARLSARPVSQAPHRTASNPRDRSTLTGKGLIGSGPSATRRVRR